jgi:hypothetical protein
MCDLWQFFGQGMCQKHRRKRLNDSRSVRFLVVEPFFGQFVMLSPGRSNTPSLLNGYKHRERHGSQLHNHWRYGCDLFMDQLLGLSGPLFNRPVAEKLWLSSIGMQVSDVSPLHVIDAAIWSWFQYLEPSLHAWAWIQTGLVTQEEMASIQATTQDELMDRVACARQQARNGQLPEVPQLRVPSVADCLSKVSAGEVAHVWQIKSGDEYVLMPTVLKHIFSRSLAKLNVLRQPLRNRLAAARDEEEQVAAAAELAAVEAGAVGF